MTQEKRLGTGLDALLGVPDLETASHQKQEPKASSPRQEIEVDRLRPNPYQPRRAFDEKEIQSLSMSLRKSGMLQPILVRRVNGTFEIVAGERRFRAAQMAGMNRVPVVIRDVKDQEMLTLALVENLQRKDLNPIEKARAFEQLMSLHQWTQEQAAEAVAMARSTVANFLRLLDLPPEVQEAVASGDFSMGHARALASLTNRAQMIRLVQRIVNEDLSVRSLETIIASETRVAKKKAPRPKKESYIQDLEHQLTQKMGTRVELRTRGSAGEIVIHYYSSDQLNGLLQTIGR